MSDDLEIISENVAVFLLLPVAILFVLAVHEMGHYIAARLMRMRVEQVSLGFGRKIWERTDKSGTRWIVNLWPFKAHVHIADYNPLHSDSLWRRLVVVLAGPAANLALPFILLSCFFISLGKPAVPTIITGVEIDMPAYEAGLRSGDEIIAINGELVQSMERVTKFTRPKRETPLLFAYKTRGGSIQKTSVMPVWVEYQDDEGLHHARGRVGFMAWQLPYSLKIVKKVDGQSVDDEDMARDLLIENFGKSITLGLKFNDRKVHDYLVDLGAEENEALLDPDGKDYDSFVLGQQGDNVYLPLGVRDSLISAARQTSEMIFNIARLPFHLFPVDSERLAPEAVVSHETSVFKRDLYVLIYLASLCSVFIGLLNLIPIPGFDGYVILMNVAEALAGKTLPNKSRAILVGLTLLILYGSAFLANAPNMQDYFKFKIEKMKDDENS